MKRTARKVLNRKVTKLASKPSRAKRPRRKRASNPSATCSICGKIYE